MLGWALLDEPIVPSAIVGFLVVVGFVLITDHEIAAELARFHDVGR